MYANRGGITKESVQINHFLFLHDEKQSSREIYSKKKKEITPRAPNIYMFKQVFVLQRDAVVVVVPELVSRVPH
jgi:hypothetical protein